MIFKSQDNHSSVALSLSPPTQLLSRLRLIVFQPSSSSERFSVRIYLARFSYLSREMVNSGEEFLMVDSYNIPWLIWIQMFVFFLLLLLLFVFGIVSSDTSDICGLSADSIPSTSCSSLSRRFLSGDQIPISHHGLGFSVNSSLTQSNQVTELSVSFNFVDESRIQSYLALR